MMGSFVLQKDPYVNHSSTMSHYHLTGESHSSDVATRSDNLVVDCQACILLRLHIY
jgi:hypothetical protein